jgi:hypothetical protein
MKRGWIIVLFILTLVLGSSFFIQAAVCTDTDGGRDFFTKGTLTESVGGSSNTATDNCINATTLSEYFCPTAGVDNVNAIYYNCNYGCSNGACEVGFIYPTFTDIFSCSDFGIKCGRWDIYDSSTAGKCKGLDSQSPDDLGIPNCKNCVDLNTGEILSNCEAAPYGEISEYIVCGEDCTNFTSAEFKTYKNDILITPFQDSNVYLALGSEDLENFQAGDTIKIRIKSEHLQLPENTPFKLELYARTNPLSSEFNLGVRAGASAITGVIDENRALNVEWIMNLEDLSKIQTDFNEDGMAVVELKLIIKEIAYANLGNIVFKSKTGICIGNIPCNAYPKELCSELNHFDLADCEWDEINNICTGQQPFSCNQLELKEYCKAAKCHWKSDSLWERFTDWVKGVFGA